MPNHVTNRIQFYGKQENINKVLELIKGEDTCIDFNKIIPMPDNIFRGNLGIEERKLYGSNNWYDWSCSHWGTKWNAYSTHLDKEQNLMEFDTAWSCPVPILEELAELCHFHEIGFEGKWADEDAGCNVGVFDSNYGDEGWFMLEAVDDGSDEAYEIYTELKGENPCIGKDEDEHWVHYDCDNCPNRESC